MAAMGSEFGAEKVEGRRKMALIFRTFGKILGWLLQVGVA